MDIEPLDEEEMAPPPRSILQTYLGLDPPGRFTTRSLEETRGLSSSQARQFGTKATKHRLAVRVDRGEYVAVDPSIAIRAWALPEYYARILLLNDVLERLAIDHAFLCLTAGAETDLIFDRPWVVTRQSKGSSASEIDRFVYRFRWRGAESLEALGGTYRVPTLSTAETALLLAATGLGREVEAAEQIIEQHPPPDDLVPAFNFFGIRTRTENLEVRRPDLEFPKFIVARRDQLSEELLRGGNT